MTDALFSAIVLTKSRKGSFVYNQGESKMVANTNYMTDVDAVRSIKFIFTQLLLEYGISAGSLSKIEQTRERIKNHFVYILGEQYSTTVLEGGMWFEMLFENAVADTAVKCRNCQHSFLESI